MKIIYLLLISFCIATSCSQPLPITTTPNEHTTTSGTMGSVKATQQLPQGTIDSIALVDTVKP